MNESNRLDKKLEIASETSEERFANFLTLYGKQILIAMTALLVCLLAAYLWHKITQGNAEEDYLKADKAYQELVQAKGDPTTPLADNPSFQTLQRMMKAHPELASRYDGSLAQLALQQGDLKLAAAFADKALKELSSENLPFYEEYSKTSLLIGEGNDREAYKRALFLQKRMREQASDANAGFRQPLLVFNQIRIATLMQRLGMATDEVKAWQEVQQLAGTKSPNLLDTLKTGQVSFGDYLQAREKALRI